MLPDTLTDSARRKAIVREIERRRRAMLELRQAASMCSYAAGRIGSGLNRAEARQAALDALGELVALAEELRRLTRLPHADRVQLALRLAGEGRTTGQIAAELGVCTRTIRYYLKGARGRFHVPAGDALAPADRPEHAGSGSP